MPLDIAVVGCGTAGQAAAVLLARAGHHVRVFEQAPHLGPVGAGLLLQPTGMSVLDRIGVGDVIRTVADPVESLLGTTSSGRKPLDLNYGDLAPGLVGFGIQRAALADALLSAMEDAGVSLTFGSRIDHVERHDKTSILLAGSQPIRPQFDLVVIADGARSTLRHHMSHLVRRQRAYAWGALWCVLDDPRDLFRATLRQSYRGCAEMIGFLPSGRASPDAPRRVSMFWSTPTARWRADPDLETWRNAATRLAPYAEPLLDQIDRPEQLIAATYHDVIMRRTHEGPVVCIGDAAHAMSPQLGQGVNLALLDAQSLAAALEKAPDLSAALELHDRTRRRNVRFYQFASRWLTPLFQSDLHALGPARDRLMGPAARIPPIRKLMLQSLAGVKTGPLSAMPLESHGTMSGRGNAGPL